MIDPEYDTARNEGTGIGVSCGCGQKFNLDGLGFWRIGFSVEAAPLRFARIPTLPSEARNSEESETGRQTGRRILSRK